MDLFIRLILAHLLGDFVFQPASWVEQRRAKLLKSPLLYLHAGVHTILVWGLSLQFNFWPFALLVGLLHLLTDVLKAVLTRNFPKKSSLLFFGDQAVHMLILGGLSLYVSGGQIDCGQYRSVIENLPWLRIAAFVFVTWPAAVVIRQLIAPFALEAENMGIRRAGRWIGMLERVLVVTFILTGHWEGVGFLLAAKSVFRFGDLRQKHDVRLTEYILIGTLLSFGLAILAGIIVT